MCTIEHNLQSSESMQSLESIRRAEQVTFEFRTKDSPVCGTLWPS